MMEMEPDIYDALEVTHGTGENAMSANSTDSNAEYIYDAPEVTHGTKESATSANSTDSNAGYKSLIKQNVSCINEYAKTNHNKEKKMGFKGFVLCCFVFFSNMLSLAAMAIATVSFIQMTNMISEYKGRIDMLMEKCDNNNIMINNCSDNI